MNDKESFKNALKKIFTSNKDRTTPEKNAFKFLYLNTGDVKVKLVDGLEWFIDSDILGNLETSKENKDNKKTDLDISSKHIELEKKKKRIDLTKYTLEISAKFLISMYCQTNNSVDFKNEKDGFLDKNNIPIYELYNRYNMKNILEEIELAIILSEPIKTPLKLLDKYKPHKEYFPNIYIFGLCMLTYYLKGGELCYDNVEPGKYGKPIDYTEKYCCHNIAISHGPEIPPGITCINDLCCIHSRYKSRMNKINKNQPKEMSILKKKVTMNMAEECKKYKLEKDDYFTLIEISTLHNDTSNVINSPMCYMRNVSSDDKIKEYFSKYCKYKKKVFQKNVYNMLLSKIDKCSETTMYDTDCCTNY